MNSNYLFRIKIFPKDCFLAWHRWNKRFFRFYRLCPWKRTWNCILSNGAQIGCPLRSPEQEIVSMFQLMRNFWALKAQFELIREQQILASRPSAIFWKKIFARFSWIFRHFLSVSRNVHPLNLRLDRRCSLHSWCWCFCSIWTVLIVHLQAISKVCENLFNNFCEFF